MRALFVLLSAAVVLSGCGGVDPNSPLGKRQAIFKQMLKTSEDLGGMLRGRLKFDPAQFAQGAQKLDELSQTPWQHFPNVAQDEGPSDAKAEVWQRQERFAELRDHLTQTTAALARSAQAAPLEPESLTQPMKQVEAACKACHKEFRRF